MLVKTITATSLPFCVLWVCAYPYTIVWCERKRTNERDIYHRAQLRYEFCSILRCFFSQQHFISHPRHKPATNQLANSMCEQETSTLNLYIFWMPFVECAHQTQFSIYYWRIKIHFLICVFATLPGCLFVCLFVFCISTFSEWLIHFSHHLNRTICIIQMHMYTMLKSVFAPGGNFRCSIWYRK